MCKLKLQLTGSRLASYSKIDVNGTMQNQCNQTVFLCLKPVGSQSEASRLQFKISVNES